MKLHNVPGGAVKVHRSPRGKRRLKRKSGGLLYLLTCLQGLLCIRGLNIDGLVKFIFLDLAKKRPVYAGHPF